MKPQQRTGLTVAMNWDGIGCRTKSTFKRGEKHVRGRRQELSGFRIAPPQLQGDARSRTPLVPEVELRGGRGRGGHDGGRHFAGDAADGGGRREEPAGQAVLSPSAG